MYFRVHIEVPVDSPGSIQECVSIICDAAINQALRVQVSTHGLSLTSSCHPRDTHIVQHLCTLCGNETDQSFINVHLLRFFVTVRRSKLHITGTS